MIQVRDLRHWGWKCTGKCEERAMRGQGREGTGMESQRRCKRKWLGPNGDGSEWAWEKDRICLESEIERERMRRGDVMEQLRGDRAARGGDGKRGSSLMETLPLLILTRDVVSQLYGRVSAAAPRPTLISLPFTSPRPGNNKPVFLLPEETLPSPYRQYPHRQHVALCIIQTTHAVPSGCHQ